MPAIKVLALVSLSILLCCCAQPHTAEVARTNGFQEVFIAAAPFTLNSQQKILQPGAAVNIYLEGDGRAWISRSRLSRDPSPRTPTVMQLAAIDPSPNVVYLARPCQYSPADLTTVCDSKYWSLARYSNTVVKAMNQAITQIKQKCAATKINLIGYSGGASIAVLVAAQREDIASIRTVAGNLDLLTMQDHHQTTPLSESLDPISVAYRIRHIPQLHFIGSEDQVVPATVAQSFCQAAKLDFKQIVVLPKVGHAQGWLERWPELLKHVF